MKSKKAQLAEVMFAIEVKRLSSRGGLGEFCRGAWHVLEPGTELKWNFHLSAMCLYLESWAYRDNDLRRLILNIPPGSMKSLMVSVFLPAWMWTWDDSHRFINLTNEIGLATRDSRRMRDLIISDWFKARWPKVQLSSDQREKTNFENMNRGFRQGLGITGNISGKRGNSLIIDDPIDAKKAFSDIEIANVNDTYDQAVSSRLNDLSKDGIVLIMQRTRTNDLTGHLMSKKEQNWVVFRVAMEAEAIPGYNAMEDLGVNIYDGKCVDDIREEGDLMFPDRFTREAVDALKEDLGEYGTAGQLQQRPTPLGGGIIKKNYWTTWPDDMKFPSMEHVFISWDTAFTDKDNKDASYSAVTRWGVFWHEQQQRHCLMVLGTWYARVAYPDLRNKAQWMTEEYSPDCHLIEKKASGQSLIQDLRRTGSGARRVRLRAVMPDRDKITRAYTATATMASGIVYTPNRKWAKKLINFCSEFPAGAPPSGDLTDTVTQAILYLTKGWWISHPDDDEPENRMEGVPFGNPDDHDESDIDINLTGGMYG